VSDIARLAFDEDEEVPVARVSGQIDMSNAPALTHAILDVVTNNAHGIVVDLSAVSYMDSSGINMLAELQRRLGWRGQRLAVVAASDSRPWQVLSLAGADGLVPVEATTPEARARVESPDASPG
jgi:anti-sigma B factor antagonist